MEENNTSKTPVTIEQAIYDLQEKIKSAIEASQLPAGVVELILRDIHNQVSNIIIQNMEGVKNGSSTGV